MNSLGSCINTFDRYKKVNSKNELDELLVLLLLKDLHLLHSVKCSVSTQLTYIQNIQYSKVQSVQSRILQGQSVKLLKYLFFHSELNFFNSDIFCNFFGIFGLLDILPLWFFFTTFGTNLQIFTKPR